MFLAISLAIAIQDQKTIHDTRAWKDYQHELKSAQMLEVRWEKTFKDRKGKVVSNLVLYKNGDKVSLAEAAVHFPGLAEMLAARGQHYRE